MNSWKSDVTPELINKAKNEYQKKWRAKNKNKTKIYQENYWKRRVEKQLTLNKNEVG